MKPSANCHVIRITKKSTGEVVKSYLGLPKEKAHRTIEAILSRGNDEKYNFSISEKYLKITSCNDPLLWYADNVNQSFPYLGKVKADNSSGFEYKTKPPSGYTNFVDPKHCELFESYLIDLSPSDTGRLPEIKLY